MNIFAVHEDPKIAAQSLCDKHVCKMIVESAQILSTVCKLLGKHDQFMYRPTHAHHPCVLWVKSSVHNFAWLLEHAIAMSNEYTKRYGRIHKTQEKLNYFQNKFNEIWNGIEGNQQLHTPFSQCMPEIYRCNNQIEAYRKFYKIEKSLFAKWKNSEKPNWM